MKLNPEQKTVYEYGKAVKDLSNIIKEIRNKARMQFATEYHELPLQYRAELLNYFGFETFVDEVRYRRAECRAFMVSNDCSKCIHRLNKSPDGKCGGCKWDISYKIVKSRWEPRKEEENETDA